MCNQLGTDELCRALRNQIEGLLQFSIELYRRSMSDRSDLTSWENPDPTESEVFFDVELWSAHVAGYATQVRYHGTIVVSDWDAITDLKGKALADLPLVYEFVNTKREKYSDFSNYIFLVDYLRMLVIEYIEHCQAQ